MTMKCESEESHSRGITPWKTTVAVKGKNVTKIQGNNSPMRLSILQF